MTSPVAAAPDPRIHDDICGHVVVGGTGIEWICIRPPHGKVYPRRRRSRHGGSYETRQEQQPARRGETVQPDRHYFVRRWPSRP